MYHDKVKHNECYEITDCLSPMGVAGFNKETTSSNVTQTLFRQKIRRV